MALPRTTITAALACASLAAGCGSGGASTAAGTSSLKKAARVHSAALRTPRALRYHPLYALGAALQDPGAAALDTSHFVLMGGLDAADTSTDSVIVGTRAAATVRATLPNAQHDAEAATLGGRVYLFGGGQFNQYDHILAFDPAGATVAQAGALPAAQSDVAVTGNGETAYIVGGFDGTNSLNTILSWRPGGSPQVVGHLPVALRYAAVTLARGAVIIVGGSLPSGNASDAIYRFDPSSGRVSMLGRLPGPLTHAGAAQLDGTVFVVGGRGSGLDSQTSQILAVNPVTGAVRPAGRLPQPLSDAGVVAVGQAIIVAGGRGPAGTQAAVGELVPTG